MSTARERRGRPRRYALDPAPGLANTLVAHAAGMLDELRERLYDLISDLTPAQLAYVPPGTTNSIAVLVVHMAWAEAGWIARATGRSVPDEMAARLAPGAQGTDGDLAPHAASAQELIQLCHDVRDGFSMPALAAIENADRQIAGAQRPMTVRGVLMHLIWHWTYHSGQVGLLRRLWGGSRYKWTFDERMGAPPDDGQPSMPPAPRAARG